MFTLWGAAQRFCDGVTRRGFLKIGAFGAGLTLADLLRLRAAAKGMTASPKSAIMVYLPGGPSHLDMWDLKPEAPKEFRGEFNPIPTNVPGIQICEHMPLLAKMADKYAIIRSMQHETKNHNSGGYIALTGVAPSRDVNNLAPSPDDYPNAGSVVGRMKPTTERLPGAGRPREANSQPAPQRASEEGEPCRPRAREGCRRRGGGARSTTGREARSSTG